jgi:translation initiation factor IF-2
MAEVTVRQLAETVRTPVDRLLRQMREAGLPHTSENQAVSEDQKQLLLAFLRRSHGESEAAPQRLTLQRRTVSTLKAGPGKARTVAVEVRKKRTYMKRPDGTPAGADEARPATAPLSPASKVAVADIAVASQADAAAGAVAAAPIGAAAASTSAAVTAEVPAPQPAAEGEAASSPAAPLRRDLGPIPLSHARREVERMRQEDDARRLAVEEDARRRDEAAKRAQAERQRLEEEARQQAARDQELRARVDDRQRPTLGRAQARLGARPPHGPTPTHTARPTGGAPARRGDDRRRGGAPAHGRPGERGAPAQGEAADGPPAGRGPRRREFSAPIDRVRRRRPRPSGAQPAERPAEFIVRDVDVPESISVGELASRMSVKAGELIKKLFGMGMMVTINQVIDQDTAVLAVEEMGHRAHAVTADAFEHEVRRTLQPTDGELQPRPPVVTVMGHVDHGKTSLLDYIRKTRVAAGESGGITQHIGAYHVRTSRGGITFIDTPGHAAFTSMRARGAQVTDIVVLVVAADDGVMPQTEEAIQHAKAAGVPLVVAVNKIDRANADPERVRSQLSASGVVSDAWGGDTQFVHVSALTGAGIDELLDAISLQAELLELRAVPDAPGRGVVIESRLDRGRGAVATILVQSGTLRRGDVVVAGEESGRVRAMFDESGKPVDVAGPSMPVEVLGLSNAPAAGDEFWVVQDERSARDLASLRSRRATEARHAAGGRGFADMFDSIKQGKKASLRVVLKTDVRGSLEAITAAIGELSTEEVTVSVVAGGVGGISENDANLAVTSNAVLFGFNVRADATAKRIIEREGIDLRYYSIIYELLDDVRKAVAGLTAPKLREQIVGVADVRAVFRSPRFGQVAGCMVVEGTVYRNKPIRVLRDDVVIFQGELESLRRFKDDVAEVRNGLECGIGVRNYSVKVGDKIEVYETHEVAAGT